MQKVGIIIPCYNEEHRFKDSQCLHLLDNIANAQLIFVNDGSKDGTQEVLENFKSQHSNHSIEILYLDKNQGKAEAVRQGLVHGNRLGLNLLGYVDADFSTEADEVVRVLNTFQASHKKVGMGSRVNLLGSYIERSMHRHYLGRVFASFASLIIGLPVYDTQCGAKFFTVTKTFSHAIEKRFKSRWVFDVELMLRLVQPRHSPTTPSYKREDFIEVPLKKWKDIGGSKLDFKSMLRAGLDLILIAFSRRD